MISPLLKALSVLIFFFLSYAHSAWAEIALSPPAPASENIKVEPQKLEVGKNIVLPANNPTRYLIGDPRVAVVTEMRPNAIEIRAQHLGSTLLIWWEEIGIRSVQIVVERPAEEIQRIKAVQKQSSRIFKIKRDKSFRVYYDTQYSLLETGKILPRLEENRKIYFHDIRFQGGTPTGDLKGALFYEYRKDQNLKKSVALIRDMWLGMMDTDLPFGRLLDRYDIGIGRQYLRLSDFGFPGSRYTGFTLIPSLKRVKNPEKGRIDLSFFIGHERRGALLDNPAGTNQRDVKLKNRFMGEKVDFYLWKEGKISLGNYQKWGGPTDAFHSKKNSDFEFDFGFPYFRLKGETGLDYRSNVAWRYSSIFENSWLFLENGFFRINPHYTTITGTTLDKGKRGFQIRSHIKPLKPYWGSDALLLNIDSDITRDLLSLNRLRPERHNKKLDIGMNWRFPHRINSRTFYEYDNKKSTTFPFTKKRVHENLGKDFIFKNSRWLKQFRIYGVSTFERYGDAVATPGFNSTRYELGGGAYVNFFGGIWASGQYLWDRLDEKEPNPAPDGRTYPGQLTVSGGISHGFGRIPLHVNMSIRYVDERKEISKLHQPFTDEDRLEVRSALNLKLPYDWIVYAEANAITAQPLTGVPETAELSVIVGARLAVDTHIYLPQKGTIEGYFFMDKNVNGVRDINEPGIAGYEVWIHGGPKAKTDSKGYYRLRVNEGLVNLKSTSKIPEGYFFTTLNEQEIELMPKQSVKIDFGIVPQVQIKGRSYLDVNRNLIFDGDDIPMPAIQILLESGQLAVTSADGLYSILRVRPGPNSAQAIVTSIPSGYKTLSPIERKFEGVPGDQLIFDIAMTAERTVNGYVFVDTNNDGRLNPDEKGVAGVVILAGMKKATTGRDGKYFITDLEPSVQKIRLDRTSLKEGYKPKIDEQELNVSQGFFVKSNVNFPLEEHSTQS